MSVIFMILVAVVAFFADLEGVLNEFQFHQPLVACMLIGLVTGNSEAGIILGGSLQVIAPDWANVGVAVAPDATLASIAVAIIIVKDGDFITKGIAVTTVIAIPLAVAGLFLTMLIRTVSVAPVHGADAAAKEGNTAAAERTHLVALFLQGPRIAVPTALLLAIPTSVVQSVLNTMPDWLSGGMAIDGGMVVAVGYAMITNMTTTSEVWSSFVIGFAAAAVSNLTPIALGTIGVALAFIYPSLSEKGGNGGGTASGSGDSIGDILKDY